MPGRAGCPMCGAATEYEIDLSGFTYAVLCYPCADSRGVSLESLDDFDADEAARELGI